MERYPRHYLVFDRVVTVDACRRPVGIVVGVRVRRLTSGY